MAAPAEEKSDNAEKEKETDHDFWLNLQKQHKTSFSELISTIRSSDREADLFVGKHHGTTSQTQKESTSLWSSLFASSKQNNNSVNTNIMTRDAMCAYTIFPNKQIALRLKQALIDACSRHASNMDRSMGSMVGMAIGDAVGHPLEFIPITNLGKSSFKLQQGGSYENELNRFRLQRGQWTDDASMGLCMTDSLIVRNGYDGSDIRTRFWNWWQNGYNNAFRNDAKRTQQSSCGLGGNISSSIYSCEPGKVPSARFEVAHDKEDSGNGSLMRLTPVPIFYQHCDESEQLKSARQFAMESSFTTHPGYIAAEACAFMAYLIVQAIQNKTHKMPEQIKAFLDAKCEAYKNILVAEIADIDAAETKSDDNTENQNDDVDNKQENDDDTADVKVEKQQKLLQRQRNAKQLIIRLIDSKEAKGSLEENWNWKTAYGELSQINIQVFYDRCGGKDAARHLRKKYNGYPVNPDYWGSYCMDGLAMALHCVYHSTSVGDCIGKCVNMLGDADSTASIAGQLAGALYGYQSIATDQQQKYLLEQLVQWDDCNFAFAGLLLCLLGNDRLCKTLSI